VDKGDVDARTRSIDRQPYNSPHIPRQYARTTVHGATTRWVGQDLGDRPHSFRLVGILRGRQGFELLVDSAFIPDILSAELRRPHQGLITKVASAIANDAPSP
jgi:hypothetical protein